MDRELLWNIEEFEADAELAMNDLVETIKHYCGNESILIEADRVDWSGASGRKVVEILNRCNEDVFRDIMPSHDCLFNLYKEGNEIYAVVSSHDIPTGARWTFRKGRMK